MRRQKEGREDRRQEMNEGKQEERRGERGISVGMGVETRESGGNE